MFASKKSKHVNWKNGGDLYLFFYHLFKNGVLNCIGLENILWIFFFTNGHYPPMVCYVHFCPGLNAITKFTVFPSFRSFHKICSSCCVPSSLLFASSSPTWSIFQVFAYFAIFVKFAVLVGTLLTSSFTVFYLLDEFFKVSQFRNFHSWVQTWTYPVLNVAHIALKLRCLFYVKFVLELLKTYSSNPCVLSSSVHCWVKKAILSSRFWYESKKRNLGGTKMWTVWLKLYLIQSKPINRNRKNDISVVV